jgi:hypothetical protein
MRTEAKLAIASAVVCIVSGWLTFSMFAGSERFKTLVAGLFVLSSMSVAVSVWLLFRRSPFEIRTHPPLGISIEEYREIYQPGFEAEWKAKDEKMGAHRAARLARIQAEKERQKREQGSG